jgi:hypothetical protein
MTGSAVLSLTYLASYITALLVLPVEVASPCRVPIEDLMRSASEDEGLLPVAISEALSISVVEFMDHYYWEDSEASMRDHLVGEAILKHRMVEEGERWLREMAVELPYCRDDTF